MRWVRKKASILAILLVVYFVTVYAQKNPVLAALVAIIGSLIVFGSALLDRIFDDPSAVFIVKPWRVLQSSAGDRFRYVMFGILTCVTVPIVFLQANIPNNMVALEAAIFCSGLFLYEFARHNVSRLRWHRYTLNARTKLGRSVSVKWSEVVLVYKTRFTNKVVFEDHKGRKVQVSTRLRGFSEFMRDAERYVPAALQGAVRAAK